MNTREKKQHEEEIKSVMEYGRKAKGRSQLLKYLNGGVLTERDAILAKCYDCCNFYADGLISCGITTCPLFLFNAYNDKFKGEEGEGGEC